MLTESSDEEIFVSENNEEQGDETVNERFFYKLQPVEVDERNLEISNSLIKLGKSDLWILLRAFEPTYENLINVVSNLYRSPYKAQFILDITTEWYLQNHNNQAETISQLYESEYKPEQNNAWFFHIIDHFPVKQRNIILERYFNNYIDSTAKISKNDDLTFTRMRYKNYERTKNGGVRVGDFMTDLKKVCAHIDIDTSIYVIKLSSSKYKKTFISLINESTFKNKLKSLRLGTLSDGKTIISAWSVLNYKNNINFITLEEICFYSQNPNVFSFFQGYSVDPSEELDMNIISPFINHIFYIICSQNQEYYKYVIQWLAYIFQNYDGKTETALVLKGDEGVGKNTFTNPICYLLGEYANDNLQLENIVGKFNTSLIFKKLLVCNEVKSFDSNSERDPLKALITEGTVDIQSKGKNVIHQENVANFIFLSNNFAPVKISEGDRRYFVLEVSSQMKDNFEYFKKLNESFTPEFYANLMKFLMTIDISGWDKRIIPMTTAKKQIIEFSKSPYAVFIQSQIQTFKVGFPRKDAFDIYKSWCKENEYKIGTHQKFKEGILKYCYETKPSKNASTNRPTYYVLKKEKYKYFNVDEKNEKINSIKQEDNEEEDIFVDSKIIDVS